MKTHTLSLNGKIYHYHINQGKTDKPPILFINGAFQNMHSWTGLASHFAPDQTTIVADLPGWGKADLLPSDVHFDFYAEAIKQILDQENIEKVTVISTSYGTPIAVTLAKKHKKRIHKLVLTAPILEINENILHLYPRFIEMIEKQQLDKLASFLLEVGLLNQKQGQAGRIKNYNFVESCFQHQIMKLTTKKLQNFRQNTQRLIDHPIQIDSSIYDIPTYVLTGEHDSFTLPANCLNIACKFSNFRFDTISNADHFFLFERPEETAMKISEFVNASQKIQTSIRA